MQTTYAEAKPFDAVRALEDGDVHIWVCGLDEILHFASLRCISEDERTTPQMLGGENARQAFLLRRAALRTLLSSYLECDPHAIEFMVGEWGKPALVGEGVHFSVSSSGGLLAIAVSRGPIGFDIEHRRAFPQASQFIDRYSSVRERAWIQAEIERSGYEYAAYALWTRKEALLKAVGAGLTIDPVSIEIHSDEVQLDQETLGTSTGMKWHMRDVRIDRNYTAALCASQAPSSSAYSMISVGSTVKKTRRPASRMPASVIVFRGAAREPEAIASGSHRT